MSYPRYEAYKDSGVEWLGEIPGHWKTQRLKQVCSFTYGDALPNETREEGGVAVYGSNGQVGTHIIANSSNPVIIIGRKGSYGKINYSNEKVFVIDTAYYVDPRHTSHDLRWLYYSLLPLGLDSISQDTGVPGLSRETAYESYLAVPPLPEQHAIAAFLDHETARIDTLIAKQEQMIALLQEKRKAIISHAVTRGLDPNVPLKDSGVEWLGMVPEHWEVKRLKFIANVRTGVAKGREMAGRNLIKLPYLRVANVQDGYLDLSDIATIDIACDEIDRYLLQPGDVLMNEGGDYDKLGRGYVWRGEIEACVHQNHVFSVRPHDIANAFWINLVTQSYYGKQYFISRSKQSTNLASISSSSIQQWPIVIPPHSERQMILQAVQDETTKIDTLINKAQAAIDLLKERRTSLISAAVTGKIDVRAL